MTVIVAATEGDLLVMAADSRATLGDGRYHDLVKKLFLAGGCVVGGSGDLRHLQVAQELTDWPERTGDLYEWLIGAGVPALWSAIGEHSSLDVDGDTSLSLIFAEPGCICAVMGDAAVVRHEAYAAVGTGAPWAEGVLSTALSPCESVELAIQVAIDHNVYCGGEINIIRVEPD